MYYLIIYFFFIDRHRGTLEERSGTPTVDEQISSAAGSAIPDTTHPPPSQQPAYQIPSFPPANRPHYSESIIFSLLDEFLKQRSKCYIFFLITGLLTKSEI